jgi:predicted RNA-binding protein YlxR (DUF448 family)
MSAGTTPQRRKPKGPRPKHVPKRMCVACREHDAKRSYVRLVRTPEMRVEVDPTGKRNGRGAYLCRRRSCWQRALDSNALTRALKIEIDLETKAALSEYARSHFPPDGIQSPEQVVIAAPGDASAVKEEERE